MVQGDERLWAFSREARRQGVLGYRTLRRWSRSWPRRGVRPAPMSCWWEDGWTPLEVEPAVEAQRNGKGHAANGIGRSVELVIGNGHQSTTGDLCVTPVRAACGRLGRGSVLCSGRSPALPRGPGPWSAHVSRVSQQPVPAVDPPAAGWRPYPCTVTRPRSAPAPGYPQRVASHRCGRAVRWDGARPAPVRAAAVSRSAGGDSHTTTETCIPRQARPPYGCRMPMDWTFGVTARPQVVDVPGN